MASGVLWMPWAARLEAVISGQPSGGAVWMVEADTWGRKL